MAKYTKKQAELGLRFWKKALNEAIAAESEEDQKKEEGAEETEDAGTEEEAGADDVGTEETAGDDAFPPADENAEGTDAKIAELEARIAELEAKLGGETAEDDAGSEEGSEEDAEDDSGEGDSEESDDDDDEDSDDDDEELDESSPGSAKYAPNTVGAVTELLSKFNPQSRLMIRLFPNKEECMVIDIDGKITVNGPGVTYMEIARGTPATDLNESKAVKKPAKKAIKKPAKK